MTENKEAKTLGDLTAIAEWIIATAREDVILLEGEMGAGKTTLIKAICTSLGVEDEVSSPTYSLVNEYYSPRAGTIYHFDLYRIEDETEALDMGIEEYLYSGNLCLIEWPEKISNLLPNECAVVKVQVAEGKRIFELKTDPYE